MPPWAPVRTDVQVMGHPSLQFQQHIPLMLLSQGQLARSLLKWECGVMSLPMFCHHRLGSSAKYFSLCEVLFTLLLLKKQFQKGKILFAEQALPCLFFPLAFPLKTFYFTKSQNDGSAFLIHFPCIFLLTRHNPATFPLVNSLLNYSDRSF